LVKSSSAIAVRFGIPAIIIGVTVVAFATSAPEIAVSVNSALEGRAGLALGNVVGSNIANILLILGLSALITPVKLKKRIIRLDVPVMIAVTAVVFIMALDRAISRWDGAVLLLLFVVFLVFQVQQSRQNKNRDGISGKNREAGRPVPKQLLFMLAGFAMLILGADWVVESAINFARTWGLSELVIGLTIVALGTSLPEVATSMVAAWKNEPDISVGNVIGSNIFNLLLVLGISAVISSGGLAVSDAALALDLPFLIAVSIACLPVFFTGHKIAQWEGGVFLAYYAAYVIYLVLDTTQHQLLPLFNKVMLLFAVPITVLTLLIFTFRYWNKAYKHQS